MLIERLERATGASRELDAEIHVRVHGWKLAPVPKDYDGLNAGETYTPDGNQITGFAYPPKGKIGLYYHVPHGPGGDYTASVGAALALIPEGWFLHDAGECVMPVRFKGDQHAPTGWFQVGLQWRDGGGRMTRANGRTLPLALCIAALKARP